MSLLPKKKSKPEGFGKFTTLIYGPSKIGKSTLVSELDNVLFIDAENGLNHLEVFKVGCGSWKEFLAICAEIKKGDHQFTDIAVDSVDFIFKFCTDFICAKHGVETPDDIGDYGKGHGLINKEFQRVFLQLHHLPYRLWIIGHDKQVTLQSRVKKIDRNELALPGTAKKNLMAIVDCILFCSWKLVEKPDKTKTLDRVLLTRANESYDAGIRGTQSFIERFPEEIPFSMAALRAAFKN